MSYPPPGGPQDPTQPQPPNPEQPPGPPSPYGPPNPYSQPGPYGQQPVDPTAPPGQPHQDPYAAPGSFSAPPASGAPASGQPYGPPSGGQPYGAPQYGEQPYAQPYGGQPPPAGYPPGYGAAKGTNGLAIGSLVASLLGLFTCIGGVAGIVLGHMARKQIAQSGEEGRGMATAGLVIGYAVVVLYLVGCAIWGIVVAMAANSSSGTTGF